MTTPVLTMRDPVAGTVGARVRLAPLQPGRERQAAYRLPTSRRGILSVGPLEALRTDPLGLARRRLTVSGTVEVVVYPRVDRISAPPGGQEQPTAVRNRQMVQVSRRDSSAGCGVRAGDDLRHVHWRSSARPAARRAPDEQPHPTPPRSCSTCGERPTPASRWSGRCRWQPASCCARRSGEMVLAATDGTMLLRPGESHGPVLGTAIAKLSTAGSLRGRCRRPSGRSAARSSSSPAGRCPRSWPAWPAAATAS
jgi:hypothetical protein